MRRFVSISALLLVLGGCASAPDGGYLSQPLDFHAVLPQPPMIDTPADVRDVATFNQFDTHATGGRWLEANDDAAALESEQILARFHDALGLSAGVVLTRDNAPHVVALLDRAMEDLRGVVTPAKQYFNRPRPIYRFNIAQFCHANIAVQTGDGDAHGDSYPSGHATRGWQAALILAQVAPDRAEDILARGRTYGDSRIVCRVHYPSDVAAGQLLGTALATGEMQAFDFQGDLAAAQAELDALR